MNIRQHLSTLVDRAIAIRFRLEFWLRGRDYRMPIERATRLFASLLEREMRRRGIWFSFEEDTQTYRLEYADGQIGRLSLSNVARELATDGDTGRVTRFARNMLTPIQAPTDWMKVKHQVLWDIQSNTIVGQSDLAIHLSDQVHQAPVIFDPQTSQILFLDSALLIEMSVTERTVAEAADANLAAELRKADIVVRELEGRRTGFVHSELPFKAALILASNLRKIVKPILGWPLFAVIPNRNNVYLFCADDFDSMDHFFQTVPGLGGHVLEQYELGAYPLSTEIFEITDEGVRAIAEYARHPPGSSPP
jgi:hypothetical protein